MQALFVVALLFVSAFAEKRAIEATGCLEPSTIDPECITNAPEGTWCLLPTELDPVGGTGAFTCGCKQDADCFSQSSFPGCLNNRNGGGTCESCLQHIPTGANPVTNNDDHLWCRDRFPSVYYIANPAPANYDPKTETVPASPLTGLGMTATGGPIGNDFFREMCNRNANAQSGACQPCHQASPANTPDIASLYPAFPGVAPGNIRGRYGSVHCNHVYPNTRPICSYPLYFFEAGMSALWNTVTVQLNIGVNSAGPNQQEVRTPFAWQGACIPCFLQGNKYNSLCSLTWTLQPVCQASGGCAACASNADCVQSAGCAANPAVPDGTCTGGNNCQADGSCFTCRTNADCGSLDRGTQPLCDVASGLCIDQAPCTDNADCPVGTNCMTGGACRACSTGTDCATNDGGLTSGQPVCVAGVCRNCALNSECAGTGGNNCEANGKCVSCTAANTGTVCGAADGGAASPPTIPDANGQTLCNTNTGICETPCDSNLFCANKGGSDAFTRGANCQKSGACQTCTPTNNVCGAADGPTVSDETTCDTATGICFNPFTCTNNADCNSAANTGGGKNCQASQQCLSCAVGYDAANAGAVTSTCGSLDGGMPSGQINCRTDTTAADTRTCVNACTNDAQCAGTQGSNCMENGLCLSCRNDADCGTSNTWGGDKGGDPLCNTATGLCGPRCTGQAGGNGGSNPCPTGQNCNKDGRCAACTTDASCVANDGPFPAGTNTICNGNGVCIDPYLCTTNANDNAGCLANTGRANCQADRSCKTCTSNADCGVLDGGSVPGQPRCTLSGANIGECGPCLVNADCPASAPNCGADGGCYDCTTRPTGNQCGAPDGGEIKQQPNCDPISKTCVTFCVSDANCQDDCAPHCNLNRGCCVECTQSSHCPLANWRGVEASRTVCSEDSTCIMPFTCHSDSDCANGLVCDYLAQVCVQCLSDSHCTSGACDVGARVCVDCTRDSDCDAGFECTFGSVCVMIDSASTFSSLVAFVFVALAALFHL